MNNEPIQVGDTVEVGQASVATVLSIDGKFARVQLPGLVMRIALSQLRRTTGAKPLSSEQSAGAVTNRHIRLHSEALAAGAGSLFALDLHGKTAADAVELLEQHVSRAVMAGMHEIEVVHGVGTGRVREAVHARLATLKAVARFVIKPTNHGVTRVFFSA